MSKKINIYDINNSVYIYEDVENILDRIGELYDITFFKEKVEFVSKINLPENAMWISNEATGKFNKSVPVIKSIIKDIYSVLESIFIFKQGKFDKLNLEKQYKYLRELREFNNKLKHHNNKNVTFNLISVVNINVRTLDCLIQYKYIQDTNISMVPLVEFFQLFFIILEDEEIITIDRKNEFYNRT